MIPNIHEINFPNYATLNEATISFAEMGERTIKTTVKIDGNQVPDFTGAPWFLIYNGEKFVLNTHTPQARKDNTTLCSLVDLVFESEPIALLKRYFFVELAQVTTNTVIIDKFVCPLRLKAEDFIVAFNGVLKYYFGTSFTIELDPLAQLTPEAREVQDINIDYTYLWEALANLYNAYKLVWRIEAVTNGYKIIVGDSLGTIDDHTFQYGYSGGLTSVERQIEDASIYNRLFGRGGEKNLPYRYFKKQDPNNELFAGDPDACKELENVYFGRLLDINFRYYVKGWLRNPCPARQESIAEYPVPTTPEPAEVQSHWAYQKGITDTAFSPVEYVQDTISIAEYGVRHGKLEDNDDIFPTIQGVERPGLGRVDGLVAVGEITDDDDSGSTGGIITESLPTLRTRLQNYNARGQIIDSAPYRTVVITSEKFTVPADYLGTISYVPFKEADTSGATTPAAFTINKCDVIAVRESDNEEFSVSSGLPGGAVYSLRVTITVAVAPTGIKYRHVIGINNVVLTSTLVSNFDQHANPNTFVVWVKDIWGTTKAADESDIEYAERVWTPILGDRLGNEAALVFSDGWMSASSDYEFKIVEIPTFDQSKQITERINGSDVVVNSEWRLTLAKTDAEMQATGKMFPNATSPKPVAGDHFFFIGIDMPYMYVTEAEKRLNADKQNSLDTKAYANPTWAIELDYVRINTLEGNDLVPLFGRLKTGVAIRIYDPRFSGGQVLTLAIRSLTITYSDNTALKPSVAVLLSENVLARSSSSQQLSYSTIQARLQDAAQQAARSVWLSAGAPVSNTAGYLSKTVEDIAYGRLAFLQGATFGKYTEGLTGTGAKIDADGHGEFDSMSIRRFLEVPELRYNRTDIEVGNNWRAPGGGLIERVEVDYDGNTQLNTGTIFLKLEDGEVAPIAQHDLCMGIFHNETGNATQDSDNSKGDFHFAGFSTCYFRVTEILAEDNRIFKYALRPTYPTDPTETWTESHHPQEAMTFVCYGNTNNTARQTSRYSTRTYERYLKNVNDWKITSANIAAQFGDLSNLSALDITGMSGYSAYLENIYMTGYMKQTVNPPAKTVVIDTGGRFALGPNEALTLTASAVQGWDSLTVSSWAITRDSGSQTADAAWAQLTKVTTFNGSIVIENNPSASVPDLPASVASVLFRVTATFSDNTTATGVVAISRLEEGSDAIMVTLDHYSDVMYYDVAGNRVSGSIVVTAKLREGGADVPNSSITWSHSPVRGGITRSANVLTISTMTSSSENITINALYGGVTYSAVFSLKRLLSGDWYEIVATPSALTYNTTTQTGSDNSITFEVYQNTQASDGSYERFLIPYFDERDFLLQIAGTDVTRDYDDGYTLTNINYNYGNVLATLYLKKERPAQDITIARLSVPIARVADGDDGPVGITYRVSVWEAGKTYRCDEDGPAQDGLRIIDIVSNKDMAMLSDPDLGIFQCKRTHTSQTGDIDPNDPTVYSQDWEPINQLTLPLATPLLLANTIKADYIDVDSLDTKLLTIKSSATAPSAPPSTCVGRMGDTNIYTVDGESKKFPFWIGGQYPYSSGTKFKIDEGGNIYASGGKVGPFIINYQGNSCLHATSGTTKIASSNFTPGMVNIGYVELGNTVFLAQQVGVVGFNTETFCGQYTAIRRDDKNSGVSFLDGKGVNIGHQIAMGSNAIPHTAFTTDSGFHHIGLFITANATRPGASYLAAHNYGVYIDSDEYSIYSPNGKFAGWRPFTRYSAANGGTLSLGWRDSTVVINNTGSMTVTLPASPKDGQVLFIHHLTTNSLAISRGSGTGAKSIFAVSDGSTSTRYTSTRRELLMLTYVDSYGYWILNPLHL